MKNKSLVIFLLFVVCFYSLKNNVIFDKMFVEGVL